MTLTVQQAIDAILADLATPGRPTTVDGFLEGDPSGPATAVVCTMMATLPLLRQAAAMGRALVISHEPLYFNHADDLAGSLARRHDVVFEAKRDLIRQSGLTVYHLHDHLHDHRPDLIDQGTLRALGWPLPTAISRRPVVVDVPATRLDDLTRHIAAHLGSRAPRFIGDPALPVRRVGLNLGFCGADINRATLARDDIDALLIGEAHEWETGEYAFDMAAAFAKGLIVAGHVPSEQQGMAELARRAQALDLGVPVVFVPCDDIFDRPDEVLHGVGDRRAGQA